MSLGGTRCQSMALDHWITHSILINLFIKPGLNNFLLPPLLSIVFVEGCSMMVFRKRSLGGARKAYIFAREIKSLGTNLSNTLKNEVCHFGLMRFSFVKMFFAYRLLLTRR